MKREITSMVLLLLVCFSVVCCFSALPVGAAEFYVAPGGNDANPGSQEQPFQTIAHVRDIVRQAKGKTDGPITVFLRGGIRPQGQRSADE